MNSKCQYQKGNKKSESEILKKSLLVSQGGKSKKVKISK